MEVLRTTWRAEGKQVVLTLSKDTDILSDATSSQGSCDPKH